MAAGEDELEALVGDDGIVHVVVGGLPHLEQARLGGERALAAQPVDRPAAGGRQQPGARIGGRAVARPALRRDRERLLGGLLREVEVAEGADQGGEHARPLLAEDAFDQLDCSTIGRTSTQPPMRTAGIRPATSSAPSRSSASTTNQPPKTSLVSANGPSVVSRPSPFARPAVGGSAACSSAPPTMCGSDAIAMYSRVIAARSASSRPS